jgi:hypothetical protein
MMRKRFVTLSLLLPVLSISGAAYADHNYQHHPNAPRTVEKSANDLVGYNSSGVAIYRGEPGVTQGRSMAHKPAPKHSIKAPLQGS